MLLELSNAVVLQVEELGVRGDAFWDLGQTWKINAHTETPQRCHTRFLMSREALDW